MKIMKSEEVKTWNINIDLLKYRILTYLVD